MDVERVIEKKLRNQFFKGKALVLVGPRQTGKSTLVQKLLKNYTGVLFLDGDDFNVREQLEKPKTVVLKRLIAQNKVVFIDEAQRISNIGITAKIITDQFKDIQLILSGSSAFELNNQINEPLTGRKWEYNLFPISWEEWQNHVGFLKANQQLETRLVYGMYPDVLNYEGQEEEVLHNLVNSYLYKDILALSGIKKTDVLQKLTQALALQMGSEVSYNELAQLLGINKETVSSYIDILEKAYIVFRVNPFSRNIRNEIKTNRKVYFYDNGIRNTIISNFNRLDLRADKGALWENFLITERLKYLHYHQKYTNTYFWRTTQQQEIDWIEEKGGKLTAYEFKWNSKKKVKFPATFKKKYDATFEAINKDNYFEFIS